MAMLNAPRHYVGKIIYCILFFYSIQMLALLFFVSLVQNSQYQEQNFFCKKRIYILERSLNFGARAVVRTFSGNSLR